MIVCVCFCVELLFRNGNKTPIPKGHDGHVIIIDYRLKY